MTTFKLHSLQHHLVPSDPPVHSVTKCFFSFTVTTQDYLVIIILTNSQGRTKANGAEFY
jgi:hypothetical protein